MKVLLDTCVWGLAAEAMRSLGHDVIWAGDWPIDPGDLLILARAHSEERVLVTLDKDYGELAVVRNIPHNGIIRLVGFRAQEQAVICNDALSRFRTELEAGAIVTIGRGWIRVRTAEE